PWNGFLYLAILDQVIGDLGGNIHRYGETITGVGSRSRENSGINSDQFSLDIDQCSAGVTGVDRRIGLDKGFQGEIPSQYIDLPFFGRDNSGSNGGGKVEWIAHCNDPFAYF